MTAIRQSSAQSEAASGNDIMKGCRELIIEKNHYPSEEGYCLGVVDSTTELVACPPPNSTVGQAIRVVVAYIDARPARLNEHFSYLAQEALINAWPCR
jgi:hypothetical protein